jgi:hypothetical protein
MHSAVLATYMQRRLLEHVSRGHVGAKLSCKQQCSIFLECDSLMRLAMLQLYAINIPLRVDQAAWDGSTALRDACFHTRSCFLINSNNNALCMCQPYLRVTVN